MSARDERRLEDMLQALASIEEHCPTSKERLESREPLLSHVVLKLMWARRRQGWMSPSRRVRQKESEASPRELIRDRVQRTRDGRQARGRQASVDPGALPSGVAEELLDVTEIGPGLQQVNSEGMP